MSLEPNKAILGLQSVSKSFGAQPVLQDISLTVHEGDRIGLIGRNGTGKSTILRLLANKDVPDAGLVTRSQGLRVGFLEQQSCLDPAATVGETFQQATEEVRSLLESYHSVLASLAEAPTEGPEHAKLQNQAGILQHAVELTDAWNVDQEIKRASVALFLPSPDRLLGTLSGGELRRLNLAVQLVRRPDVLLLDEPTNHIDSRSVEWIEGFLASYPGSCVLVTHDRYFLDRVVTRIVELEFGKVYSFAGSYGRFLEYKSARLDAEASAETGRQAILRRELAWLRRGPKARSTKQKARIDRYAELDEQGPPAAHKDFVFEIPESKRLGKRIIEVENISVAFDDQLLFQGFSFILQKDMRVGIIGPNGCGKTTLLRALMGVEDRTRGKVMIGDTVEFLYIDQSHEEVRPSSTILQHVSNGQIYLEINGRRMYVPAYLEKFLFSMDSVHMPMSNLSGGERNRLDLAKKMLRGGNVMILDEPTNDLDLPTLRLLEETIVSFQGCALIVSHDRYFLNRICTHMLIFEDSGRVVPIVGNYDDYLIYREKAAHSESSDRRSLVQKSSGVPSTPPAKTRRISFREKRELDVMETTIQQAEAEAASLDAVVHGSGFYQQDYKIVQAVLSEFESAKKRVDALYARWAELETLARGPAE